MAIQANPYPLRVDKNVMDKIKYISKENGRSVNKEIEFLIRKSIASYEMRMVLSLFQLLPKKRSNYFLLPNDFTKQEI